MSQRQPILFLQDQDIRFGELDSYGHVNAKHYLDIVASARIMYMERQLGCTMERITEAGFGFYLRKATQNFRIPIVGLQRVFVKSFVSEAKDSLFVVDFKILNHDQSKTHAMGQLEYVVVDLKTERPTTPPTWLEKFFFTGVAES